MLLTMGQLLTTLAVVIFFGAVLNADWTFTRPYEGWAIYHSDGTGTFVRNQAECMARCILTYGSDCLAESYRTTLTNGWEIFHTDGKGTFARNKAECMASCVLNYGPDCLAASYRTSSHECLHFNQDKIRIHEMDNDDVTSMITEWPEALYVGNVGTFADAGYLCNYFGGRLLNYSEAVEYYYNREITLCKCGWLSDGSQFQISHPRSNYSCGDGVVACEPPEPVARVWCRINV